MARIGRPPTLRKAQIADAQELVLGGQSERSVAKRMGVPQSTLAKQGLAKNARKVKAVAQNLADAEAAMLGLPLNLQVAARMLADELKAVSLNLASAAKHGSATANHLSLVASVQASKIDPHKPQVTKADRSRLADISALQGASNQAAHVGLNLLSANKETTREAMNVIDVTPEAVESDPVRASQTYQRMVQG